MNNLKRVLSLALASVMLIGMMAVGASATDVSDFSDGEKVTHADAVSTMATLGVIEGNDDGTYAPERILKRGEMTAIIARLLNGGVNPALGTSTSPLFTDVVNHWSRPYVEYCANLGIVDGMGDGTFHPEDTLTAAQAAKMLLGAAGYKSNLYGFTGNEWELNVNRLANQKGLYNELASVKLNTTAGLKRDDAAQMAYNTLSLHPIEEEYSESLAGTSGTVSYKENKNTNMLAKYFGGAEMKYGYLTRVTYNEDKKEYTYRVQATNAKFGNSITVNNYTAGDITTDKDFSDLFGQRVEVIYKVTNGKVVLFGLTSDANVIAEGAWGKATNAADTFKFGGTTYDKDQNTVIEFLDAAATDYTGNVQKQYAFKAYDNDANGNIDAVVVFPFTIEQVSYLSSTNITTKTVKGLPTAFAAGSLTGADLDEVNTYDGIKKGDYVKVEPATTVSLYPTLTKVEADLEGKIDGTKTGQARVDGTWYPVGTGVNAALDTTYKFFLQNGYIAATETVPATATISAESYAVVTAYSVPAAGNGVNGNQAKLLFADGTTSIVNVSAVTVGGTTYTTVADVTTQLPNLNGDLVTYTTSGDNYILVEAQVNGGDATKTGYDLILNQGDGTNYTSTGTNAGTFHSGSTYYAIADNSVVFVKVSDGTFKVITGADLKKYDKSDVTAWANVYASTNESTKFSEVAFAYVTINSTAAAMTTNLGYVTSGLTTVKNAKNQSVSVLSFWTVDGQVTDAQATKDLSTAANGAIAAGTIIRYTKNTDGTYEITKASDLKYGAIYAWDATTGEISFTDSGLKDNAGTPVTGKKVTSDTVVLYIDSYNVKGVEGGSIALAEETETAHLYYANAYYLTSTDVTALVVDTYGQLPKMKGTSYMAAGTAGSNKIQQSDIVTALASNTSVTVNTNELTNADAAVDVEKGQTLTLTGTSPASQKVTATLKDGGTLVIDETATFGTHVALGANSEGTVQIKGNVTSSGAADEAAIVADVQGVTKTATVNSGETAVNETVAAPKVALKGAGKLVSFDGSTTINGFIAASKHGDYASTSVSAFDFTLTLANNDKVKVEVTFDGETWTGDTVSPAALKNGTWTKSGAGAEHFALLLGNAVKGVRFTVTHSDNKVQVATFTITRT